RRPRRVIALPADTRESVRALVKRQRNAALPYRRVRAQVAALVQVGIRPVHPRFERRYERAEAAAVAHDDDFAVRGLPQVAGVDRGRRREALIVRAAHQHLAADAAAELASGDRYDVAVPPLAFADSLTGA